MQYLKIIPESSPAVIDPDKLEIDCIGRFSGLVGNNDSKFLKGFLRKCEKALKVYTPVPDPRPRLLRFCAVNKEDLNISVLKGNFQCGKELLYRIINTENKLVRSVLETAGFKHTESHDWNIVWIGKIAKPYLYDDLGGYQRINHFPNTFEITRKDKMCLNLQGMKNKFPKDYSFFPDTYVIPKNLGEFTLRWYKEPAQWIVKPYNSSQGKGIYLLETLNDLDLENGCIVSKYIESPLLLNNLKSDLRIYVLITSFEPLKIYVYQEGLARFACENYSESSSNKFVYLTNYSVNKRSEKFVQNTDWKEDNIGHKWSFSAFLKELAKNGYDTDSVTKRIYDLIIKTIISIEALVVESVRKLKLKHNNCFDLLGFDVLVDSNLKPWLLEVNLSPSMNTDSSLDLHIKSNLISDVLNLIGVRAFDRKKETNEKIKSRIKAKKSITKSKIFNSSKEERKESKFNEIYLENLEESLRLGHFNRVFPFYGSDVYDGLFKSVRKINKIFYKFLFFDILKSETIFPGISPSLCEDDLINEYLSRTVKYYKGISETINFEIERKITQIADFLNAGEGAGIGRIQKFLTGNTKTKVEKLSLMKSFTDGQLENMVKSIEKEIVKYLIDDFGGVLDILKNFKNFRGKKKSFKFLKLKKM